MDRASIPKAPSILIYTVLLVKEDGGNGGSAFTNRVKLSSNKWFTKAFFSVKNHAVAVIPPFREKESLHCTGI